MVEGLSMWETVQAQTLLMAVHEQGTLTRAAIWLGLPLRTAQKMWARWGLAEDHGPLPRGAGAHLKNQREKTPQEKRLQHILWCAKEAARGRRRRAEKKRREKEAQQMAKARERIAREMASEAATAADTPEDGDEAA